MPARRDMAGMDSSEGAVPASGSRGHGAVGRARLAAFTAPDRTRLLGLGHELVLLRDGRALELVGLLARPRLDVRLGGQRLDGLAQVLARVLDLGAQLLGALVLLVLYPLRPDFARVFRHSRSSYVASAACSATGGVTPWPFFLPCSASTPAIAA